ncbi:hypothetical protein CERZMDRAFT_92937 [Cercospora zeae-maydis SCOH1-5]|uniref:Uncharacterized protein n=1 Tax=Cercospora zeae-maydis SCOH1-5 TaxID=717836 RepID=A0A6A6FTQ3_9PEZI|nr:hypothetical protein CERZMDRAFT_92937 [Cercospora zeae-maydis SCOH1-5]
MDNDSMPLSGFSVASAMADQNVGLRHYTSVNDARTDRMCRARCAPQVDDLDIVQANEHYFLNRILEALLQVIEHDHKKPTNMDICTDHEWTEFIQGLKEDVRSKAIDENTGLLSPQAERMGRFLLEEVFFLHEYGWHVDLWKPHVFRRVTKQYEGMRCADRIDAICDVLGTCAPIAHDILEGKNLEKIASAPAIMMEEKISYKKSNKRRSLTTKEAKRAKFAAHRQSTQQSSTSTATSPASLGPTPYTSTPSFPADSFASFPSSTRNKRQRLEPSTSWIPAQPEMQDWNAINNEATDLELPLSTPFAQYDASILPEFEAQAALPDIDFSFSMPSSQQQHTAGNISGFETSFDQTQPDTTDWGAASGAEFSYSMPNDLDLNVDFESYTGADTNVASSSDA